MPSRRKTPVQRTTSIPGSKRWLRMNRLVDKLDIPSSSLYELIQTGDFPKPIHISQNRAVWVEAEVDEWMDNVMRQARSGPRGPLFPAVPLSEQQERALQ